MDSMFSGKTILGGPLKENILLFGNNTPQANLQEIHVEILNQNDPITSPNQAHKYSTNLYEYFTSALCEDSEATRHFQCHYCNKKFLCFKALYNHAHMKHRESASQPLKCFICQQLFVFTKEYCNHLSSDHQIRYPDAICNICLTTFMDSQALQNHKSCHPAKYSCERCSTRFQCQNQLSLHEEYHNCSKEFSCSFCGASFQSKLLRELHLLRHKQVECPLLSNNNCASITSEIELINHFKQHHSPEERALSLKIIDNYDKEEQALSEVLQNGVNTNSFDYKSSLSKIKFKQDVECSSCSTKLTTVFQLWIHFNKKHINSKKCPFCDKHFAEASSVLIHLGSASCKAKSNISLTCSQCKEIFQQEQELLKHQLTHVKPLQCSECGAIFQKPSELKSHMQGHGLLPEFPQPVYVCPVCSSQWSNMTNLRRHIRSHADVKPFQCEYCGATFKRQQSLREHCKSAHGGTLYMCPHCGNSCRSKQALFLHVCRVHVRLRRFVCGLCAKPWPQNQDLRRHLSNVHNIEYPPLKKSIAVPFKSVHVIPPIENLAPEDPLRLKVDAIIREETEKLKSLNSDFDVMEFTPEDADPDETHEKLDSASIELQPTAEKIYISCNFCDFCCDDLDVLINHTNGHQQSSTTLSVNNQQSLNLQSLSHSLVLNNLPVNEQQSLNIQLVGEQEYLKIQPVNEQQYLNIQPVDEQETLNIQTVDEQQSLNIQPASNPLALINQPVRDLLASNNQTVNANQSLNSQPVNENQSLNSQAVDEQQSSNIQPGSEQITLNIQPGSEQVALNSQPLIDFSVVPVLPIQQIFFSPVLPINYSTLVTVIPGTDNVTTINQSFSPIDPTLREQAVAVSEMLDNETVPSGGKNAENEVNSGELININGMFIRIEQCDGDASEIIRNSVGPSISIESGPFERNDKAENALNHHVSAGKEATEDEGNELMSSEDSDPSEEINGSIEDIWRSAGEKDVVQINHGGLVQLAGSLNVQKSPDTGNASTWPCQQCGKVISTEKNLKRHMRLHTGERPFTCHVCDKAFTERHNLKVHMLSHTQERPYSCSVCGKTMRYFKEYDEHKKKHQGVKEYSCSVCARSFVRQRDLVRHKTLHFSEKKYQCPVCSKMFLRLDYLRLVHMPQVHGKFPCNVCKKRFESEEKLEEHQRTYTHSTPSKKRFTCPVCEKTFSRNSGLKTHLELHTNAHVVCYACPRKFNTMESMLAHLCKFHKKWRDEIQEENRAVVENVGFVTETEDPTGPVFLETIQGIFETQNTSVIVPQ